MLLQDVIDLLRVHGPLSRAEVARRSNVSKPTASTLVKTLIEANLIYEGDLQVDSGGRPARLLHFNAHAGYVIGMDIGGTKARAAIADLQGNILTTITSPTQSKDTTKLITQIKNQCLTLCEQQNITLNNIQAITIGTPGVINPTTSELQYAHNLPALEFAGAVEALRDALGRPVFLLNDVNLAALGERWAGAAQAFRNFVFMSIGTGLGFGVVVGGEVYEGVDGRAGEFGYVPFPPGGSVTLEDRVSGPGIAALHKAAGGSGSSEDAFTEADKGTPPGAGVIHDFLDDLAWAIAALGAMLDPECVILGGGLGVRCEPYLEALRARVASMSPIVPVLKTSVLRGDAGLHGAISVALSESYSVEKWLKGGAVRS